jgi:hypothetical protein
MEAIWFARRAALHCLAQQHPDWTHADQALAVGASESWVKKWLARLKHATTDPTPYQARSHARQTPPPSTPRPVVERILALRDAPPAHSAPWCPARAPSCFSCSVIPKRWLWACPYPARRAPFGRSCARMGASPPTCRISIVPWTRLRRWPRCRPISPTLAPSPPNQRASGCMPWKPAYLRRSAEARCPLSRFALTSTRKRHARQSSPACGAPA